MSGSARPDAPAKTLGAVEYGLDADAPGMRWGVLVLAPVAAGTIRSVDLDGARRLPSVVAVGAADVARLTGGAAGDPDRPPFPAREIAYRHQPVAAVAAPSLAAAREAARAVRLEIEERAAVGDLESIFPDWPGEAARHSPHVIARVHARRGDVAGELARASEVVQGTYRTAAVQQVPLEPHACLAEVTSDGRWRVRTSTQSPFGVREDTASILGLPERSIEVDGTWVGGGFGGKGASLLEPYALLLAREAGAPVRLALTYREEFLLGRSTLPLVVRLETGLRDGQIVARRIRLLLDVGASLPGRDFSLGIASGFLLGPYRTGPFELEGYAVRTNKPPFGPHRAPLAPQTAFVVESHLAAVARAAGQEVEPFRASLLWTEGDRTALGQPVGPFGLRAAHAAARDRAAAWRAVLPPGHGVGVGVGFWSTNTGAGGEARVRLGPEGLVIEQGEREIGSGSVLVGLAAVAARRTGLPFDRVRVDYRATPDAPFDSGVYGSRTVGALGQAVDDATVTLLAELGRRLGARGPATLSAAGPSLRAEAEGRSAPIAELLTDAERRAGGLVAAGRHYGASREIDSSVVLEGAFYPFQDFTGAAHVAEVAVDAATGEVRVVRYAAFHDAGTVFDPASARAQVEGGVVMGLGTALTEEARWSEDGRLTNPDLVDYRIPGIGDVPPIEVTFLEGFPGAGPQGAKGIGEPPIVPVPATIAAAVREAVGAEVPELPLTPERVARAVKAGGRSPPSDAARRR